MLAKKIILGLVLLATATLSQRPMLLPTHLAALTSNVTAVPHRLSDARRIVGSRFARNSRTAQNEAVEIGRSRLILCLTQSLRQLGEVHCHVPRLFPRE